MVRVAFLSAPSLDSLPRGQRPQPQPSPQSVAGLDTLSGLDQTDCSALEGRMAPEGVGDDRFQF